MSLIAGAETIVNTYTATSQISPSITGLSDGGWVATWSSEVQDGSYYGIFQQRFAADGTPAGAEMQVNTETVDSQVYPSATSLSGGGWVVTWQSVGQDGNGWGVYEQRYDALGNAVGMEIKVNSVTANSQYRPSTGALADGGWVVAWTSDLQDGSGRSIYQQRYDVSGSAVGGETLVNSFTNNDQEASKVTGLANGGWVVTWASASQDSIGTRGVYGQMFDANGAANGSEFQINTYTANDQGNPVVTSLADGGFLVTWQSAGQDGNVWGTYQQRYDANGAPAGQEQRVNTTTMGDQSFPTVTGLTNGGWVVSWTSADGDGNGIYLQYYNADGSPNGGERLVNTDIAGSQAYSSVTALADGGFVVAWQANNLNGSDILQKVFHPVVNTAPSGTDKTIAIDEDSYHDLSAADFGFSDTESDMLHAVIIGNMVGYGLLTLDGVVVKTGDVVAVGDLGNLRWTPGADASGLDVGSISFQVRDNGGTLGGGVDTDPTFNVLHFDVTGRNDAPSGTANIVSAPLGASHVFSLAEFGFHDDLEGDQMLSVIITTLPGAGTLMLSNMPIGSGQEILVADIGNLVWMPPAVGGGSTTFYFQVRDDGGIANNGVDTDPTPETFTIDYGPHQAPQGVDLALHAPANAPVNFTAGLFEFSDPDGDQLQGLVIASLPNLGTLVLNGQPVMAGQEIAAADIGNLVWTPPAAGAGTASFQFQIRDDGGTANGGVDLDQTPNSVSITYGPHQAPQGADVALYVLEDAPISFSANQFLFADADGDHLAGIVVSSLPNAGSLTLHGQAVAAGAFIDKSDISWLAWTPVKNAFGDNLGNFTFQVVDDGGIVNGGQNTDQTASLVAIHVSDVLDRFIGNAARNTLTGTAGNDLMDGKAGNDKLTGGAGGDVFVFRAKDGRDGVTDFDASPTGTDIVDIRKIAAIVDFTDLTQNHMHEANGNVIIDGYGTSRITLKGVAMADLTADDFLF